MTAIRRLQDSRTRLIRAMQTYTGEQRELANDCVQIATAAIAVASLGTSLTASVVLRGATAAIQMQAQAGIVAGTTLLNTGAATLPHVAFEGREYTAERAMYDALIYGGGELVGGGATVAITARTARNLAPEVARRASGR